MKIRIKIACFGPVILPKSVWSIFRISNFSLATAHVQHRNGGHLMDSTCATSKWSPFNGHVMLYIKSPECGQSMVSVAYCRDVPLLQCDSKSKDGTNDDALMSSSPECGPIFISNRSRMRLRIDLIRRLHIEIVDNANRNRWCIVDGLPN